MLRPALAAALLLAALAVFGARFHWVEEAGSAERDGFVAQADLLLAGELPRDPYRPLLYPLLVAGTSAATGLPTFAAARTLSNLAAAALALLAFALAERLAGGGGIGRRAGWWALALTAVNPNLWILGQHASTDMLFAALVAGSLLAALAYLERPRAASALAAGALLGLAAFTRSNAIFLLPALALAGWWAPRPAPRRRLAHALAAAAAFALCLLPHWALRYAVFGDPFYDENYKNLAWKLYGYPDWSYLDRVPFDGVAAIVLADPSRFIAGAWAELARFASGGLAQLLGTGVHAAVLAAGVLLALGWRRRQAAWLLVSSALALTATAMVFFTWGRLLLYLLPVLNALGIAGLVQIGRGADGVIPSPPRVRALDVMLAALVVVLAVKTFAFRLPAFVERHPTAEIALLAELEQELPAGAALAGTSPFLGRYLEAPYVYVPDAFGAEVERPELYFEKLRALLAERRVRFLVTGSLDLRDRPRQLLDPSAEDAPSWLVPLDPTPDGDAVAWRVELGR